MDTISVVKASCRQGHLTTIATATTTPRPPQYRALAALTVAVLDHFCERRWSMPQALQDLMACIDSALAGGDELYCEDVHGLLVTVVREYGLLEDERVKEASQ